MEWIMRSLRDFACIAIALLTTTPARAADLRFFDDASLRAI